MTTDDQLPLLDQQTVEEDRLTETLTTSRFGIAEWYGHSFFDLTVEERKALADFKPVAGSKLSKSERFRIEQLLEKYEVGNLTKLEESRLNQLQQKEASELEGNKVCPFKSTETRRFVCNKPGGICSLRLYQRTPDGAIRPLSNDNEQGGIRATCPNRFHEAHEIFGWVGDVILGQPMPRLAGEVGFLESEQTVDSEEGADVGRLDMILVDGSKPSDFPMSWAALEIQAVYFSGRGMEREFVSIKEDLDRGGRGLVWPTDIRRPDYRSSGPKRLMPQLQIKVPTLRRWGKKMAVVVDRSFFRSIGSMNPVPEISNSDIAWFVVDFELTPERRFKIKRGPVFYTTLEESVQGLTGGRPVAQATFEERIREKMRRQQDDY